MTTEESTSVHPFDLRDDLWPSIIDNWGDWLTAWTIVRTDIEAQGLLYRGFDPICHRHQDGHVHRLRFYLTLADSWSESGDRPNEPTSVMVARQRLRAIAFKQLALNFFKNTHADNDDLPSWAQDAFDERLFPALMHFFRTRDPQDNYGRLVNLPGWTEREYRHPAELATTFLQEFAKVAWYPEDQWPWRQVAAKPIQAALKDSRPKLVQMLYQLKDRPIDFLKTLDELDGPTHAKLVELALAQENRNASFGESRAVHSIEEAYACGSKAAEILILRGVSDSEEIKRRERHNVLIARREALSRAKKLSSLREIESEASSERIRLETEVANDRAAGLLSDDDRPPLA